jgi:uncharacterized protein (DUF1015 family)
MAIIRAFRALRPQEKFVSQVASVPYDVVNVAEARALAAENPHSFLRVTRSEIEFADGVNVYAPEIYRKAQENLAKLQTEGVLIQEDAPSLYAYRLTMNGRTQTSIVACCAIDEYDRDLIKKHEKTRPDKEDDRTNHIVTTRAQTGLIFLCYRGTANINSSVDEFTKETALYDFTAADGIRHEIWRIAETENLVAAFGEVPLLYVADGHHRAASASRARAVLKTANNGANGDYDYVIAALFPAEQLEILAYNRIVKDLHGLSETEFLQKLSENFVITETENATPENSREICVYLSGKWRKLKFAVEYLTAPSVIEGLDVSILENYVLRPILGINDVRTDKRIEFVGGIRGTAELEKLVDSGYAKVAFSMYPTTIEDLLAVADENQIMPPKSTWFEPKLRDGLLVNLI